MYKAKPMIRLLLGSSAFDPEDKSAGLLNRISQRQGFLVLKCTAGASYSSYLNGKPGPGNRTSPFSVRS